MYIKITELKNRKIEMLDLLLSQNYSSKYIQRFTKTFDLICDLVKAKVCKTFKQLYCWFERYFQGFNRERYHSDLNCIVSYLENGCFKQREQEPMWMRNSKFKALPPEFKEIITFFSDSALKRGLKPSTINAIAGFGTNFFFYFHQEGMDRIRKIKECNILDFFEKRNLHSFTSHQSIRALFHENTTHYNPRLCTESSRIFNLVPTVKQNRKNIQFFTSTEMTKIKEALLLKETPITYRDRAICIIAMYLGLRGSDIRNLHLDSIDWNNNVISLVQQKTSVPLMLPLMPVVGNAIYDYIKKERPKGIDIPEIFICRKQPYQKMAGLSYSLNVVLDYCGIRQKPGDRRGLHLFRHHLATGMLANDVPVPVISDILGHSSSYSTQAYLSADLVHLKELALSILDFTVVKEGLQ